MVCKAGFWALAVGTLLVAEPANAQEAKPVQPQFVADGALAKTGKTMFSAKACTACHSIGKGRIVGPDLNGLFERRTTDWIKNWLKNPTAMLAADDTAKAMLKEYNGIQMPNLKLTDAEVEALMHYIASEQKAKK